MYCNLGKSQKKCSALRVWVFIAQLVEHCSVNANTTGSNPVQAPKTSFFRVTSQLLKLQLQLRWSHLHFICISAVHIISIPCLKILQLTKQFPFRDNLQRGGVTRKIAFATCLAKVLGCKLQEKSPKRLPRKGFSKKTFSSALFTHPPPPPPPPPYTNGIFTSEATNTFKNLLNSRFCKSVFFFSQFNVPHNSLNASI